jgi:excisionase family DNA binding protein
MIAIDSANLDLMALDEAAIYLRIDQETLARLAREKQIPATKLASRWHFSRSLLDDWLRNQMLSNCHMPKPRLCKPGLFSAICRLLSTSRLLPGQNFQTGNMLKEVGQPKTSRIPQCTRVSLSGKVLGIRSPIKREILHLMGLKGLGRSWKIIDGVLEAGLTEERNSVRNALRALTQQHLIVDYQWHGKIVRWKVASGGSRRLVMLTQEGATWCCEAFGKGLVRSELLWAVKRHSSIAHGVGILETRDNLRAAGYAVYDDPETILQYEKQEWRGCVESDLIVHMNDAVWPVMVRRKIARSLLTKWEKAVAPIGRLALILFNAQQREKQEHTLRQARRLSQCVIRLTSLEEMQVGDWEWGVIDPLLGLGR